MAIFGLLMLAMVGLWGWSLVDILGRANPQWRAIGHDRTLWLLVVLFVGVPGSIGYLLAIKPKLDRAKRQLMAAPAMPMIGAAPPGWYPDPSGMPMMRWFDGRQWTPQTAATGSVPMGGQPIQPMYHPPAYAAPPPGYAPPTGHAPGYAPPAGHAPGYAPPPAGHAASGYAPAHGQPAPAPAPGAHALPPGSPPPGYPPR